MAAVQRESILHPGGYIDYDYPKEEGLCTNAGENLPHLVYHKVVRQVHEADRTGLFKQGR